MSALAAPQLADDYVAFCHGVRRLCTLDLLQYKRGQMERRIRTFAARRDLTDLGDYLALLKRDETELARFLDRVTINVSQLWRNPDQWTQLARNVLPEAARDGRLRAWSAGCSYGAEAYTLAAVCRAANLHVAVRGTDIDARMIERAREGVFSDEDARSAPPAALERWFEREDEGWRAGRDLRRCVAFETGDLLQMRFPRAAHDLVLCRNTVIYFTDETRDELHGRLADSLRPGGFLMIGSTERVTNPAAIGLEAVYPFVYRRV
jgi:chemotaxis protein methyltransferase CheR